MVDLDDLEVLHVDRSGMLDLLLDLPDQLQLGERLGQSTDLPSTTGVRTIVVTGLGGSGISGDLLRSYLHANVVCPLWSIGTMVCRRSSDRDAGLCD